MQSIALVANVVTIVATTAGLLVGAVSWYTGHLHQFVRAVQDVPQIKDAVERIDERSQTNGRLVYTLAVAVAHDRDPDPEAFAEDLGVDGGVNQYFEGGYGDGGMND